jgi:uncharacterized protein DUF4402
MRRRILFSLAMALAVLTPAASGQESAAIAEAGIGVSIISGVSLQKAQDLIVGEFRPGQTLGTVDVTVAESNGGAATSRSASGGVALAGSAFSAAQFSVTGPPGGPVHFNVVLPSSIRIQRIGGSETMTVDRFRSNVSPDCGPGTPAGGCPGSPYTLMVGATLHVDPNQTAGRYVGTFTVTVNQL